MGRMIQRTHSRHAWTMFFFEGDEMGPLWVERKRNSEEEKKGLRLWVERKRLWFERQGLWVERQRLWVERETRGSVFDLLACCRTRFSTFFFEAPSKVSTWRVAAPDVSGG